MKVLSCSQDICSFSEGVFHTLIPFSGFCFTLQSLIAWKLNVDVSISWILREKSYINIITVMMIHIFPVSWIWDYRILFTSSSDSLCCYMVAAQVCVRPVLAPRNPFIPVPSGRFKCWELPGSFWAQFSALIPGQRAHCSLLITTWIFHGNHKPRMAQYGLKDPSFCPPVSLPPNCNYSNISLKNIRREASETAF